MAPARKRDRWGTRPRPSGNGLKTVFVSGDAVTVIVGSTNGSETFTLHKDLVCATSDFFKAATSSAWAKVDKKAIELPEYGPREFKIYIEWLYDHAAELFVVAHGLCPLPDGGKEARQETLDILVRAWLLGDYLCDRYFKNAVMASIMRIGVSCGDEIGVGTAVTIANSCQPTCGLYRWMVDVCCFAMAIRNVEDLKSSMLQEFWPEMTKRLLGHGRSRLIAGTLIHHLSAYEEQETEDNRSASS